MSVGEVATLVISERIQSIRFEVRARPRSKRTEILGVREGALLVALAAPPVDGEANAELTRAMARALGVALREVTISVGASGRRKVVEVRGIDRATALARLTALR